MNETNNIWASLVLLLVLCIPALIWLFRWFRTSHYAFKEGQSLSSVKCKSCSNQGSCASVLKESPQAPTTECPAAEELVAKFAKME